MKRVSLGRSPLSVSSIGLGCMGMSEFYGPRDDAESLATLEQALDSGINFFDTADMYGLGHNERLLGKFLKKRRKEVVIATKFGIVREDGSYRRSICGRPEYVREACEASLRRLGIETIDLYYCHRVDSTIPIEETVGAMADLARQGKVRELGISEASAATLRRANEVFPLAALQTEYSLWTRDPEREVLPACRELGIAFVAYSPLGRGFLTGRIRTTEGMGPEDFRRFLPRLESDNLAKNLAILERLEVVARGCGCTPAQLALAWLLAQGDDIVPIPGTKRRKYLDENTGAVAVRLDAYDLAKIDAVAPRGAAAGERYTAEGMKGIDG
ncbi:MAG: aldo/keto reductase [Deltaproteobacteria bacterium]|nr:aldo/keto reductase [Deltaproteobacteria bacterium]